VSIDPFLMQARRAAEDLRASGSPILPLADAYQLDAATRRLLQALVGLQILAPDEIPALAPTAA
jgi:hypothetical protein